jgi:cbb3-type cytochrome oxidase maturation protein
MRGVLILLPVVLALGAIFAGLFVLAVRGGQFDLLDDLPERILHDED